MLGSLDLFLLYSTGNSTQYSVITLWRKNLKKNQITESFCCVPPTNTTSLCESWTIKKVEHRRTDAFELWCWRRLLRNPWPARRSNQSVLKEINSECSLEGLTQQSTRPAEGSPIILPSSLPAPLVGERGKPLPPTRPPARPPLCPGTVAFMST